MPTILEFPARRPKPEIALQQLLSRSNVKDFGLFGFWDANIILGSNNKWVNTIARAKIDTGASISLFPLSLINDLNLGRGIAYELYGVVRTEACKIEVYLHKVDMRIRDHLEGKIELKSVWSAFTSMEGAPILLGYKDVLERLLICQRPQTEVLTLQLKKA